MRAVIDRAKASALCAAVAFLVLTSPAAAAQYQVIHNFCTQRACADGEVPRNALVMDSAGALYGAASGGGDARGDGTVFQLAQTNGKWRAKRLHVFCQVGGGHCDDGSTPQSALILDAAGNLYGTAENGGAGHWGAVFEILRQNGGHGFKLLHSFQFSDGASPATGLTYVGAATGALYDGSAPLYGTAGGGAHDQGVAFEMTKGPGGRWILTVIHDFGSLPASADGENPSALIADANGNLYGTTNVGGAHNQGVVFELSNSHGVWTETVLHDFCAQANCADGGNFFGSPLGGFAPGLVMDASGNLLGATSGGGAIKGGCCGVLFKLVPNGASSTYTVLYDFCSLNACLDGAWPIGSLTLDASGNLFGATFTGGGNNSDPHHWGGGTVFEFSGGALRTLYAFCAQINCTDGAYPPAGIVMDASGSLFGMTQTGGADANLANFDGGTAFVLTP